MAEESGLSEAELQAELEQMEAEGDEAMADVTVEDAVRAPTPPAPLALDEGAGVADTTTPKSPYRAPRDPVPLGKYTAVKISKIRAHPEMDSEEEGNYMKGDEFEVTEVVEVSGKTGQAPRVRGRTEMGWITLRLGDNVDKVEEASPRKGQKGGADKLGEYLILGKKGAKLREGPELDSALCAYALEKGEVKEVTEVKVVTNTAGKDVVRGHCSEGWFTIKDGMVEHLAMDAASPGKSPKNKGQGGRRGSVAQDGTSQVVNAAADIASQLGAVQEKQFAVVQGHLKKVRKKKVSENCVLKVGSMSLVLFDGPNPLETYLYTTIKRWQISKEKQRVILFFNDTSHHDYKFVRFTTLPGEQEQIAQLMSLHAKQIQKAKRENKKAAASAMAAPSIQETVDEEAEEEEVDEGQVEQEAAAAGAEDEEEEQFEDEDSSSSSSRMEDKEAGLAVTAPAVEQVAVPAQPAPVPAPAPVDDAGAGVGIPASTPAEQQAYDTAEDTTESGIEAPPSPQPAVINPLPADPAAANDAQPEAVPLPAAVDKVAEPVAPPTDKPRGCFACCIAAPPVHDPADSAE